MVSVPSRGLLIYNKMKAGDKFEFKGVSVPSRGLLIYNGMAVCERV